MQIAFVQLEIFEMFIELQFQLNLKRVPYQEELIRQNRWGRITRQLHMDVGPLGSSRPGVRRQEIVENNVMAMIET